ncbi:MAG: ROK family protein [Actinomycetia bacterium]|nr:ROK family protein [Actinomycetes bacterium]
MASAPPSDPGTPLLGLDIGGTKALAVVVDPAGADGPTILERRRHVGEPTPRGLAALVAELAAEHGAPAAVGVGIAGYVGLDGIARTSAHVGVLVGVDVAGDLRSLLGLPVVADNDANCAAFAAMAAPGAGAQDLVTVTFGTGIGAGVVVGGRLVRGAHGFAGEPGHAVVDPSGPECPCGQRGCWERYASGSGLALLVRSAIDSGTLDPAPFAHAAEPTGEELMAAARAGDGGAMSVVADFSRWVAVGLGQIINLLDPEVVFLGGGLVGSADMWLAAVQARLDANPTVARRGVRVEVVPWGVEAGAVGAALLANRLQHDGA